MKAVSFSIGSKNSSSNKNHLKPSPQKIDEEPQLQPTKEFLTEFDPSKPLGDSQSKTLVIPPKPNEWRPFKKMRNLDLPIQTSDTTNGNLQFETFDLDSQKSLDPNVSYGLNLRKPTCNSSESAEPRSCESIDRLMVKKLRDDLNRLPEDRGFEEFDDVPVEGFGAALLAGYGWHEGRGIGRNPKGDVEIVEYERRAGKEGLGFVALSRNDDLGDVKVVEDKKKERERGGSLVGKDVRIVDRREIGLKGRVLEVAGDYVMLMVIKGGKEVEVKVRICDVAEWGPVEEQRCIKKLKEVQVEDKRKCSKRSRGDQREEKSVMKNKVCWLTSNIRVRIISKELKGGRLYLRKGKVVDVVGPTTCDISMDDSRELIQGVDQELLETALPRSGGPVLVLYGKYKGVYGSLVEKDREKETAVVQDADTRKPVHVLLEQIAEYIGDPSDVGY